MCTFFRGLGALVISVFLLPIGGAVGQDGERPNLIVIFTDDQGSIDMNAYGANYLHTPHMDALARSGVRFTQFYAAAPVCSPSRAGLMTGRTPLRAGLPGNAPSQEGRAGMPADEVTLAEMMRDVGYATAHVGKWHLGYTPSTMPNQQGFDYSFGHMGGCIDNYSHFFYWNGPNRHDLWKNGREVYRYGQFFPDLMVEEASRFIEEHRDEPFLLYFAMNTPHYPIQYDEKWLDEYEDLPYPRNLYAAFLSTMDERVGAVVDKVEELGLREETLIIFQSDHGHSVETRGHNGGGNNGPYRGAKFSLFEGGIRVPAIVSMPGVVPEGEVRSQLAHGTDWLPTIAEVTGVDLPNRTLDGKSLWRVILSDAVSPHDVVHWQVGRGDHPQWAVREGPWKLIGNPRDPTETGPVDENLFLANLEKDRTEMTNFADAFPEVVRRLRQKHDQWVEEIRHAR